MSEWILLFSAILCFSVIVHFALYELQANGYYSIFKLKNCIFRMICGIAFGLGALFLERAFSDVGNFTLSGVLIIIGAVMLVRYLKKRTKFRYTSRALRVAIPVYILCVSLFIGLKFIPVRGVFALLVSLILAGDIFIVGAVNAIIAPFERRRNYNYAFDKTQILRNSDIVRIVITGSYGKTSCKNILTELLKGRYQVVASMQNYNTPLGLAKSIEAYKDKFLGKNLSKTVIFIGEAGARRKGDINEMCSLIVPTYGIVTGITAQHLESFKSIENIVSTKGELPDFIGENGTVVFNGDNKYTLKMSKEFKGKGLVVGSDNIKNLKMTPKGTSFELVTEKGIIPIKTSLLGVHNALNVALSATLALELGVTPLEISELASNIKPASHRLEVIDNGGIIVLDDSYNANPEGVKRAAEVLGIFEGRKVILAQGIVECGRMEKALNREIGRTFARVADVMILTGKNSKYLEEGLKEGCFKGEIYKFSTLGNATEAFKNILRRGDVLYLQNDLP